MNADIIRGKIREKAKTQAQVAEAIGISSNSLNRKLLGKREFTISEATKLVKYLDLENPGNIFFNQ